MATLPQICVPLDVLAEIHAKSKRDQDYERTVGCPVCNRFVAIWTIYPFYDRDQLALSCPGCGEYRVNNGTGEVEWRWE